MFRRKGKKRTKNHILYVERLSTDQRERLVNFFENFNVLVSNVTEKNMTLWFLKAQDVYEIFEYAKKVGFLINSIETQEFHATYDVFNFDWSEILNEK